MNIILGGGASGEYSKETDDLIKTILEKHNKKILYVPLALRNYKTFEECYAWFTKTYSPKKYKIRMITNFSEITQKELNEFDVVFIGGGNTYNLLHEIRKSGFDKLLKEFSKTKYIYGGSAGAIILGENITTTNDENRTKLKNFQGLRLLNYSIYPHYEEKQNAQILKYVKKTNTNVVAIPEKSGTHIANKTGLVLDREPIKIFTKTEIKTYKPKQTFKLD